jgi:hypothetical protein
VGLYFDTTDGYLRFISTVGQTTVPFFPVIIFSGGSKNIAGQMTAPFFPVINFQVVIGVCILTRTPIMVLTTGKNYYRKKRYDTVVWPANFFGRFKLQPEKITTGKKRYSCLANG